MSGAGAGSGSARMSPAVNPERMDDMSPPANARTASALPVLAAIALSACGSDEPARSQAAASPSAEPTPKPVRVLRTSEGHVLEVPPGCGAIPAQLRGTWNYELRPEEIPPEWSDARTGAAQKTFGPGNFYTSPVNGRGSEAHACVKGDVVHISRGPECPEEAGNERLRWKVDGDELTLTPVPGEQCFIVNIHFGKPTRSRTLQRDNS